MGPEWLGLSRTGSTVPSSLGETAICLRGLSVNPAWKHSPENAHRAWMTFRAGQPGCPLPALPLGCGPGPVPAEHLVAGGQWAVGEGG